MPRKQSDLDLAFGPPPNIPGLTAIETAQLGRARAHREICNQFWKYKHRRHFAWTSVRAPFCPSLPATPLIVLAHCAKREREDTPYSLLLKCKPYPALVSLGRLGVEMFAAWASSEEQSLYADTADEELAAHGFRSLEPRSVYSAVLLGCRGGSIEVRSELDLYEMGLAEAPL